MKHSSSGCRGMHMPGRRDIGAAERNGPDYKIGEVAELLDTTPRTLRFYEEQGMLMPFRTAKGTRLYSQEDIARLGVIQHLARLDVPLRTVRELAAARPESRSGDEASHKVSALLNELRRDVEEKQRECQDALQQISATLQLVEQCFGCRNKPTSRGCKGCPVEGKTDKSRLFHLILDQGEAME